MCILPCRFIVLDKMMIMYSSADCKGAEDQAKQIAGLNANKPPGLNRGAFAYTSLSVPIAFRTAASLFSATSLAASAALARASASAICDCALDCALPAIMWPHASHSADATVTGLSIASPASVLKASVCLCDSGPNDPSSFYGSSE